MAIEFVLEAEYSRLDGARSKSSIHGLPERCPSCGRGIHPILLGGKQTRSGQSGQQIRRVTFYLQCPIESCLCVFLATYSESKYNRSDLFLERYGLLRHVDPERFVKSIEELSPRFCSIYNQARIAEENELTEIAGCGYRRSLEFLVKDYMIAQLKDNSPDEEIIKKMHLGDCIKKIDDPRIRSVAKQATWLGNDETHYLRKFEELDIQNLKELIQLTSYWIDANKIAEKYNKILPIE